MANGAFNFKDITGNVIASIGNNGSNITITGGTLDLSGMAGLTLGNITMSGTTQTASTASFAPNYVLTSSFNSYTGTTNASSRLSSIETITGSLSTTGSNRFNGNQTITGSLTVTSFLDVQELRTTYISSSILYRSGSTKFGDESGDTHAFTGSLLVNGTISGTSDLTLSSAGSTTFTNSGTNPIIDLIRNNNSSSPTAQINFKTSQGTVKWQVGTNQSTGVGYEINEGDATNNRFYMATGGAATFSNTVQANGKLYLQRASNGADTLLQFKNEIGADRAYIKFGGTNEELAFYAGAGGTRNMIIGSDGAMGFNYATLAVRSFMFRALADRPLAIEVAESGGVHSLYFRPNSSGRHLITSNYLSGGVYLPLSLSGRENDADLVLNNGNTGIGVTSPSNKLDVQTSSGGVFGATYSGAWSSGYLNHSSFMATSLTGGAVSLAIGVANSTYNVGKVVFNYAGSGSSSNSVGLGFWDNDNVLRVFASGQVMVGSPTNAGTGISTSGYIQANRTNGSFVDPGSSSNVLGGTTYFIPDSYSSSNNGYLRLNQDASTITYVTDWDGHIAGGTLKTIIFKHGNGGNGVQLTNGATSWSSYTSDARTKTIHRTIENTGLETISKLNGVVYTMSKVDEKYGADTKMKIGFTAQNVQEAIPEAVFVSYQDDDLGDVLTYTPDYIIPYLVESIKELKAEIEILKNN